MLARRQSGVQGGTGWLAHWIARVGPLERDSLGAELIQIGSAHFRVSIPPQAEAVHLVDNDDKEIGTHFFASYLFAR